MNARILDVQCYVEDIKRQIIDDVRADVVPAAVRDFSDLHLHVDANEYLIQSGVPWETGDDGNVDLGPTNAVTDLVHAWLQQGGIVRSLIDVGAIVLDDLDALDERPFVDAFLADVESWQPDATTEPYGREEIEDAVSRIVAETIGA